MARIKMLTAYYLLAHKRRQEWANWKWRIFAILLVLVVLFYVNDYLQNNYYATVSFVKPNGETTAFVLADKLFYWFATGLLLGMISLAIIYEGEFVLALMKLARGIEGKFENDVRAVGKGIFDAERLVEREVERDAKAGVDLITPEWSKKIQAKLKHAKAAEKKGKTRKRR